MVMGQLGERHAERLFTGEILNGRPPQEGVRVIPGLMARWAQDDRLGRTRAFHAL
jgi:hypothetical protein